MGHGLQGGEGKCKLLEQSLYRKYSNVGHLFGKSGFYSPNLFKAV